MTTNQLSDIERALGELRGDVRSILRQLVQERDDDKVIRSDMSERIGRVEVNVATASKVAAQALDVASGTERILNQEVRPQTDKLKNISLKAIGFLAGAGLLGGATATPVWSAIANVLGKLSN